MSVPSAPSLASGALHQFEVLFKELLFLTPSSTALLLAPLRILRSATEPLRACAPAPRFPPAASADCQGRTAPGTKDSIGSPAANVTTTMQSRSPSCAVARCRPC